MIISDLSILEVVSEEKDVMGGVFNLLSDQKNKSIIIQKAKSESEVSSGVNFLTSAGGATSSASNSANVLQINA